MEKYIFIAALIVNNTAWSMDHETQPNQTIKPNKINTKDLKKVSSITPQEDGKAILGTIITHCGFRPRVQPKKTSSLEIFQSSRL